MTAHTETQAMRERLEAIQRRVDAATPAPWVECGIADGPNDGGVDGLTAFRGDEECILALADRKSEQPWQDSADMEFIAHAREDVPYLLALLTRQQEEIAALTTALQIAQPYVFACCHDDDEAAGDFSIIVAALQAKS